ncbi:glycosyltransferase, partial [Flavobacterium sp.]|uniref:glycosyltransferase n=1 Tax=Flavobacterium sp. TaxID=239 RepID=UPI0037BEFF76
HFYGPRLTEDWKVIPLVRAQVGSFDKLAIRAKLGYAADDFIICSFGFLDATKLNHILIEAWHKSRLSRDMTCHLIFVGENHGGDYGSQLEGLIAGAHSSNPILITGFVSSEEFETYLQIADLGVQLRTRSRGETSAAILDCMNHALAVIVNANGSMSEIDPEAVLMLPDDFSIEMLSEAIEALWQNPSRRLALGEKAKTVINSRHNPSYCAAEYVYALEKFNSRAKTATPALIKSIVSEPDSSFFDSELLLLADDIAKSIPLARPSKCLFLDVTATCQNDLKTGIERVVRELLFASLETTVSDIRIEPVYLCNLNGQWHYRYARQYMLGLMQIPQDLLKDDIVDFQCGDTLLGLDLSGNTLVQAYKTGLFQRIRDIGVQVHFMVYDLLPVRMPERFPPGTDLSHTEWLKVIANFDGVICISKAVASDFASWRQEHLSQLSERPNFQIQWSHLGCDMIKNTKPFKPSSDFPKEFELFRNKVNFLMVGTIEPRKAYSQVIKAFGKLWQEGKDVNLIIVGREGWLGLPQNLRRDIPGTIELIRKHPELNKHLFWLNNLSDELLDGVYANSTALIAASYGEGFGLPLIEAAQHGLPLIVRDIDIFREVAGTNASYFSADSSDDVANAINLWLNRDPNNVQPTDNKIPLLTWQECATNIFTLCTPHVFEYKKTRLLFDISVTYRNDFKTGIQRVVRGVLSSLLKEKLDHIEVVPVLLNTGPDGKMVYKKVVLFAERDGSVVFDSGFSDFSQVIEPRHDDLLLGLDLAGSYVVQAFKEGLFYEFQSVGAKLYFMVHDLLPIRMPQHFSLADRQGFESWLDAIAHSDGVVCNSLSTAEDFKSWFANRSNSSNMLDREFKVMTFHLGADIENSSPTVGSPANAQLILSELMQSRTFLSVGTLEPRKGYQLVLDAFEILWQQGQEVTWVIVGKTGWMMENFCKRVTNHRLYGKNLFWFEGISDEFLGEI